jgi:wyosine [tRNA(Phe)-imidazoG37] synthetase (radical SAM superfamily)
MTNPSPKYRYLFGPVPSRRLGRSLGVDPVPFKTCTQNCLYCQLGTDAAQTLERKNYVPPHEILEELRSWLQEGITADYITISGSGEPTLHSRLDEIIDGIHRLTNIPAALITNGSLFWQPDVRKQCRLADVVLPSLDAGDPETFSKINQPHPNLSFERFIEGLILFRNEYSGPIWLEVFLCEGLNTDPDSISNLHRWIEKIRPDKVQLNTAVRPTAHPHIKPVPRETLQKIAPLLRPDAEIIADFPETVPSPQAVVSEHRLLETLKRRPCALEELAESLQIAPAQAAKHLQHLLNSGQIYTQNRNGKCYFCAK